MPSFARHFVITIVGVWMLVISIPDLSRIWQASPSNGLTVNFDGVVIGVEAASPADAASIALGDRIIAPLPRDLYRDPPGALSFRIQHGSVTRAVKLTPRLHWLTLPEKLGLLGFYTMYFSFLILGSVILLLRPNAMTWAFYLYCTFRRYGDLGFYWPGLSYFYWANVLILAIVGGASCAFLAIFALRFPSGRLDAWRRPANRIAILLAVILPIAWAYTFARLLFYGLPSVSLVDALIRVTSLVYLGAAALFIVTLLQSHGEDRERLRWILIFPVVIVLRVIAINQSNELIPYSLPGWFSPALVTLAIFVPITVAYAIIRRRIFDVEFAISRALVYASITSVVAGSFLLLDWYLAKQFANARIALMAEVVLALALGSWLNQLHHTVDRFIDGALFRRRHLAEQRLARAATAVARAESYEVVDRFLAHEPVDALELTASAVYRRDEAGSSFVRVAAVGHDAVRTPQLPHDDPLVLRLLAEPTALRLADVIWSSEGTLAGDGNAVLALPILLREQLAAIALYGGHGTGTDIDPDEMRSLVVLARGAASAYVNIEAHGMRARIEFLTRECEARNREIEERDRAIKAMNAQRA